MKFFAGKKPVVLCLGVGFTSAYLERNFGGVCDVFFLSRRPEELQARGMQAVTQDVFPIVDLILDTTPAAEQGGLAYPEQMFRIFQENREAVYIHISTTSVYGGGEEGPVYTVDESTPPAPDLTSSQRRLQRETRILSDYERTFVIRAGGIYGPGRSLGESFRAGDFSRLETGNRMVSRIHVHDLCALALGWMSARRGKSPGQQTAVRVVNGVDEYSAPNKEVFEFLESELKIQLPDTGRPWRSEPAAGRRVESLHARSFLPEGFRFPSYREGFRSCLMG